MDGLTIEERRRELVVRIVGSMDGDHNDNLTGDEVLSHPLPSSQHSSNYGTLHCVPHSTATGTLH